MRSRQAGSHVDFPGEKLKGPWINIFDPLDPVVGFDPHFANDYLRDGAEVVVDIRESSWGQWRHNIVKYLSGPRMRAELKRLLAGAQLESLGRDAHGARGCRRAVASERESVSAGARAGNVAPAWPGGFRCEPVAAPKLTDRRFASSIATSWLASAARSSRAGTLEGVAAMPEQVVALASALRGATPLSRAIARLPNRHCATGRQSDARGACTRRH